MSDPNANTDTRELRFAGSQAALWFGDIVEVMEPALKTGVVYLSAPDYGGGLEAGYVSTNSVIPIGEVARELLEMRV